MNTVTVLDKKSKEEDKFVNKIENGGSEEEIVKYTKEEINKMIGKYVRYTPEKGTYSKIVGNSDYSGSENNNYNFITEDLKWRIWNIENNKLILVSDDVIKTGRSK
ncbi:MAG: hypothetical protein HFJ54_05850 [Clostridia bacterium]|nr:hypothetical protein [Clostridia bacterium]